MEYSAMNPARKFDTDLHIMTDYFEVDSKYRIIRPRGRADWLIFFTIAGRGSFGSGEWSRVVERGEVVLIPPGVPQNYGILSEGELWSFYWVHFNKRPDWGEILDYPEHPSGIRILRISDEEIYEETLAAMRQMHDLRTNELYRRNEKVLNALERALLILDEINPRSAKARWDDRIGEAIRYMVIQSSRKLYIEEVARKVGLSVSRLSHLFTEQVGRSFGAHLELIRMNEAKELLESSSKPISEIAHAVGYEDALYFSKRYKKTFGSSPRDYRRSLA